MDLYVHVYALSYSTGPQSQVIASRRLPLLHPITIHPPSSTLITFPVLYSTIVSSI